MSVKNSLAQEIVTLGMADAVKRAAQSTQGHGGDNRAPATQVRNLMSGQPKAVANVLIPWPRPRTATVLFGLERKDHSGSVEDIVDLITRYDARLITLHSSETANSSQRTCIYANLDIEVGKIAALRENLDEFGETLYFKSIE